MGEGGALGPTLHRYSLWLKAAEDRFRQPPAGSAAKNAGSGAQSKPAFEGQTERGRRAAQRQAVLTNARSLQTPTHKFHQIEAPPLRFNRGC